VHAVSGPLYATDRISANAIRPGLVRNNMVDPCLSDPYPGSFSSHQVITLRSTVVATLVDGEHLEGAAGRKVTWREEIWAKIVKISWKALYISGLNLRFATSQ
jgi:hypothetical protein